MRLLLDQLAALAAEDVPVGRAVAVSVWGSAPQPAGACLVATADGRMAGSVSGGCVEGAVVEEIGAALTSRTSRIVDYGVSDETAWSFGLACGGMLRVLIEPEIPAPLLHALEQEQDAVWARVVSDSGEPSDGVLVLEDGSLDTTLAPHLSEEEVGAIGALSLEALRTGASGVVQLSTPNRTLEIFLESHPRPPTLVIFGGVHIATTLVSLARRVGFRTVVADGREAFLTRERFPDADELVHGWPSDVFRRVALDRSTAVCVLTHDPKFDDPALTVALRSEAFYVGALGSRKTQATRRERLRAAGITDGQLDRLHGPIGLDLGGHTSEEIALSILAEVTACRRGGPIVRDR